MQEAGASSATARVDPERPPARWLDIVRLTCAGIAYATVAAFRQAFGKKRRIAWSVAMETWIAAARGAWSLMPVIGVVRWRNATEVVSPLKTDGLSPRYVRSEVQEHLVKGAWLEPPGAERHVLLYFHGGGYVFGSMRSHGELIGALARATRARTFAPAYRLGPEHPAPAAAEDAIAAYRYLLEQGIPPGRIVFAGDSAGGTIVLNALIALRDRGLPSPAAGVAISPWVDLACSGASFETNAGYDFVGREHCLLAAASYLNGLDPRRPDISPLFADLARLPPLLVQAGDAEVLLDQIKAFAARAQAAGVNIRLSVYADMVHVWHLMRHVTPDAQRAIDEVGAFARERTQNAGY